jgi:hypothetical protein
MTLYRLDEVFSVFEMQKTIVPSLSRAQTCQNCQDAAAMAPSQTGEMHGEE